MINLKDIFGEINDLKVEPISGTDAAFLYAEAPKSPMHIGGLSIVEGSLSFEDFRAVIASRIHQVPKFRKKLVSVPMNLDYPYWADDPNFDLDMHLHHIALPAPRDWETLRSLSSSIFSIPLDKSRPLWELTFVEGLDGLSQVPPGSVAVIAKIHHVMIDGMSGLGIMGVVYDMMPNVKVDKTKKPRPFNPEPIPNELAMLLKSSAEFVKDPLKLPKVVSQTLSDILVKKMSPKLEPSELPKSSMSAPKTIFNENISARRKWGTALLSFDRIKKLKDTTQMTVNDLMLGICSGAIRKYLLEKDKLPSQSLIANVPVSIRKKSDEGKMNNKISNILINLATNIEDPIERLETIHEHTIQGKLKNKGVGAKKLTKLADAVPFGLANVAAGIYSRYNLSKLHNPIFNVTISNVPGPQFPLYLNGHKVQSVMAMAPIIDGLGLIINILSYNGQVTISATSDATTIPDIDVFARYLRESANELEELILAQKPKPKSKTKTDEKKISVANEYFLSLKDYIKANPTSTSACSGRCQLSMKGEAENNWQYNFNKEKALIKKGVYKKPDLLLVFEEKHLKRIISGELGIKEAAVQGRIKVNGDEEKMEALLTVLAEYQGANK